MVQELPLFHGELVGGTPTHAADRTWLLRLLLAGLQACTRALLPPQSRGVAAFVPGFQQSPPATERRLSVMQMAPALSQMHQVARPTWLVPRWLMRCAP